MFSIQITDKVQLRRTKVIYSNNILSDLFFIALFSNLEKWIYFVPDFTVKHNLWYNKAWVFIV